MKMRNKEEVLEIEEPQHLQCQHEEGDTLLAFRANNISNRNILVSSSDTDVLIILLGLSGRSEGMTTILAYGSGNHRRYIAVAAILEKKKPGITGALTGFHALTGCDFPSCFFRKGKVRSFQWLEEELKLKSLTSQKVDIPGVTSFFCQLYGFRMVRLLARIKKINSSSLPPCTKTLSNHIKRAHYVARMWRRVVHINPTAEASPTDCGWKLTQNCFQPD